MTRDGFVRTLLFPCDDYQLAPERLEALRDYAIASGSQSYFLKGPGGRMYTRPDSDEIPFLSSPEDLAAFHRRIEQTWPSEPIERYWRGEWSTECIPDHFDLLEHVLLATDGTWIFLFSDEDHGYLVSDPATSRELLARFETTPEAELEKYARYVDDYASIPGDPPEIIRAILEHATAGLWP